MYYTSHSRSLFTHIHTCLHVTQQASPSSHSRSLFTHIHTCLHVTQQASPSYKVCSALDPDKGTELELTVYTLTVHDGGVNQGLCAESKMSDETEADGACTEASLLSRARFATSPTVTRCESDSVAVVTLLVNWSLKKLLLGTR